jgi:hypothetical protein
MGDAIILHAAKSYLPLTLNTLTVRLSSALSSPSRVSKEGPGLPDGLLVVVPEADLKSIMLCTTKDKSGSLVSRHFAYSR